MLVLSREPGTSVMVNGPEGGCLLTVLQVCGGEVSLLISFSPATAAGALHSWKTTLSCGIPVEVGVLANVTLVDVREEKARIGIVTPGESLVYRLEVWEAVKRENNRAAGRDPEDGLAGAPVPRPEVQSRPPWMCGSMNHRPKVVNSQR